MTIPAYRTRAGRAVLASLVTAALCVPVPAAARARATAPAPANLPALTAATLPARYAANRAVITSAARMAEAKGDLRRARALRAMAGRAFLSFDARGDGRAVEVLGDLATAERVAVLVPGADTTLDTYDALTPAPHARLGGAARALYDRIRADGPAARTAVVAWLGYTPPHLVGTGVLTTGPADEGARALRALVASLRAAVPSARVSLLCHSYGSVVCGRAAPGLRVSDIALFGSPGTGAASAAALRTPARVWAGRGARDWISRVPHVSLSLFGATIGFGADPVAGGFGARVFGAGGGGHSDYLAPGSASLANLSRIALGRITEVTR
ncbi:alpha/beta hydrolase [Microbispora sp. ZYX-F-249]|uniref:Alpha/beta hydrolase n=1 Tax=Microbispora maris TaxID=3144104 RepID=A0ABV0AST9_9ACTN